MIMPDEPTYWSETVGGETIYHCAYCLDQQTEHHSTDLELFTMHMAQRHDGRMLEGPPPVTVLAAQQAPPEHPHGGPPGQTGEHPDHPHGEPPGQSGEHPQEPDPAPPAPTHPIAPEEGT